jgi:hypothetical protein
VARRVLLTEEGPAATLAELNFMSLCGLHRQLRGALIGKAPP